MRALGIFWLTPKICRQGDLTRRGIGATISPKFAWLKKLSTGWKFKNKPLKFGRIYHKIAMWITLKNTAKNPSKPLLSKCFIWNITHQKLWINAKMGVPNLLKNCSLAPVIHKFWWCIYRFTITKKSPKSAVWQDKCVWLKWCVDGIYDGRGCEVSDYFCKMG